MIESAFYGKQAILHCARIKSQLQHWLTTGNAFFMRNQLQTIGTIVLLTHIQFKNFPQEKHLPVYTLGVHSSSYIVFEKNNILICISISPEINKDDITFKTYIN